MYTYLLGHDKNVIQDILEDIPWRKLADEMELRKKSIHEACKNEYIPSECCIQEVVQRFIDTQQSEPCWQTVEKIITILEKLDNYKYQHVISQLREEFDIGELLCKSIIIMKLQE